MSYSTMNYPRIKFDFVKIAASKMRTEEDRKKDFLSILRSNNTCTFPSTEWRAREITERCRERAANQLIKGLRKKGGLNIVWRTF